MTDPAKPAPPKAPTRAHLKLLDAATRIGLDRASEQDAAYLARELVQVTLPHSNPGDDLPAWTRRNGNLAMTIRPGWDSTKGAVIGYPYGVIPRLLLFWLTSEAVRTKSRLLELGIRLSTFMAELGLDPSRGGPRSDAVRLREQMRRLFSAQISFERTLQRAAKVAGRLERQSGESRVNMTVASETVLWWSDQVPDHATRPGSWVELSEEFFRSITAAPVPVDVRAIKALQRSPLALDLYVWLCHEAFRAHTSGKGRFVAWPWLMQQLGAEYGTARNFGIKARAALNKILLVYPDLRLGDLQGGVQIEPDSLPAIRPRKPPAC